jgi:hypothetical protein
MRGVALPPAALVRLDTMVVHPSAWRRMRHRIASPTLRTLQGAAAAWAAQAVRHAGAAADTGMVRSQPGRPAAHSMLPVFASHAQKSSWQVDSRARPRPRQPFQRPACLPPCRPPRAPGGRAPRRHAPPPPSVPPHRRLQGPARPQPQRRRGAAAAVWPGVGPAAGAPACRRCGPLLRRRACHRGPARCGQHVCGLPLCRRWAAPGVAGAGSAAGGGRGGATGAASRPQGAGWRGPAQPIGAARRAARHQPAWRVVCHASFQVRSAAAPLPKTRAQQWASALCTVS